MAELTEHPPAVQRYPYDLPNNQTNNCFQFASTNQERNYLDKTLECT